MKKLLLTGFGPYASTPINPAEQVAKALDGQTIEDIRVLSTIVPNTFYQSIDHVKKVMTDNKIDYLMMMGEYHGRSMVTFERYAHQLIDASRYQVRDNEGVSYDQKNTVEDGPVAYESHFPLKAMVETVRKAGVPADISDTAGTFVCNHLFYGMLHHIKTEHLNVKAGWVHLPLLPSTATLLDNLGKPSMSVETSSLAIKASIKALAMYPQDISQSITAGLQI